jgi:predicted enzyme related to lactoylglutathione lyase
VSYDVTSWWQQAGPTVFTATPAGADLLADEGRPWAINFRVGYLDATVAQLREAGIAVTVVPEVYPNGRFAALVDPEGNPVQLWEPAGADVRGPA